MGGATPNPYATMQQPQQGWGQAAAWGGDAAGAQGSQWNAQGGASGNQGWNAAQAPQQANVNEGW